jgi:hypothetical protein
MQYASAGIASLLRTAGTALFIVSAIIFWGAWTPTTASGLWAAGGGCLAASFVLVRERTAGPRVRRERVRIYDEPLTRERERDRTTTVR